MRNRRSALRAAEADRRGSTMLELSFVMLLLGSVVGTGLMLSDNVSEAYRQHSLIHDVESKAYDAMEQIQQRLRSARVSDLVPSVEAPFNTDTIDFRRNVGFDGAAAVVGGLERLTLVHLDEDLEDGLDNDDDGLIDEAAVVLITDVGEPNERTKVLCRNVLDAMDGEVLGDGVDNNDNGLRDERGFAIDISESRIRIRLAVGRVGADGFRFIETAERTLELRNAGDLP